MLLLLVLSSLPHCSYVDNRQIQGDAIAVGSWNQNTPWDLDSLYEYNRKAGQKAAVVLWYQSWDPGSDSEFCTSCAQRLYDEGYAQVVTWAPMDWKLYQTVGADQPDYSLEAIVSGEHDDYIRQYAQDIKTSAVPIYLRPMHEMNGDWYPWGENINGNKPEKFKEVWIHIHDIFEREGVANVEWVWSPNVGEPVRNPTYPMNAYYPGDYYVDWLGLDGYNYAGSRDMPWYTFEQIFASSYSEILAVSPDKPLMIAETGSDETGGSKAQWIEDMQSALPIKFPNVKALIWFNQDEDLSELRIDSSQPALRAYRGLVNDPYFRGKID